MNTQQENRILLIVETAINANNYIDCDVVQDAIAQLQDAKTYDEAREAIAYLTTSLRYRGADFICMKRIETLFNKIESYEPWVMIINDSRGVK